MEEEMIEYERDYDFCGWAVVDNMVASVRDDGTIPVVKPGALSKGFAEKIPICWKHDFQDPDMVIGVGVLKPVDGGIYFYAKLDYDSSLAQESIEWIHDGRTQTVSIYANRIVLDDDKNVINGIIRALSLVAYDEQPPEYRDTKIERWRYNGKLYTRTGEGPNDIQLLDSDA